MHFQVHPDQDLCGHGQEGDELVLHLRQSL